MNRNCLRSLITTTITALAITVAATGVQAQTPLPIKPGLWEVHMEREVNGQKMPDMSERMKSMTPGARQQFEAMMKKQGIDPSGGGLTKVCYSKEMVARGQWVDHKSDCKTDFGSRTSSSWKWHTSCSESGYQSDGEATFTNPENYVVNFTSVSNPGGKVHSSHTTMTGKWVSADCGDVKPLELSPQ
jgi:hypothetical protein